MPPTLEKRTIPWAQLQEYITLHKKAVISLIDLEEQGIMTK